MTLIQKKRGAFLLFCLFGWMLSAQDKASIISEIRVEGLKKSERSFIDILIHSKAGKAIDNSLVQVDILRLIREPAVNHATYKIIHINDYNFLGRGYTTGFSYRKKFIQVMDFCLVIPIS